MNISNASIEFDWNQAKMIGDSVTNGITQLGSLDGIFADEAAFQAMDPTQVAYWVEMQANGIEEGDNGGLFWGISHVNPGKVGEEYFMTRGHVHKRIDTAEYYVGLSGEGLLLMIGLDQKVRIERVKKNSLHFIPGETAHRLINTGNEVLSVGACWQSISGHDYQQSKSLLNKIRIVERDGSPMILNTL